jgi:hypothetical protein
MHKCHTCVYNEIPNVLINLKKYIYILLHRKCNIIPNIISIYKITLLVGGSMREDIYN